MKHITGSPNFQPSFHPFNNGFVINYKKVGTRFISHLNSYPLNEFDEKLQVDLNFLPFYDVENLSKRELNFLTHTSYLSFELDNKNEKLDYSAYSKYTNFDEFLNFCNAKDANDLIFNPSKDIIFLIKHPSSRCLSGITQVIGGFYESVLNNEIELNEVLRYTGLSSSEFKRIFKIYLDIHHKMQVFDTDVINFVSKVLNYILDRRWDIIFQDIHIRNYLENYIEWIYNIKDKSKIKIIDLNQISSKKGLDFFNNLRGDDVLNSFWNTPESFKRQESNKNIYYSLLENINNRTISLYLEHEVWAYERLVNSPYFIDLSD